ncbi:MAG TPA: hypothetical protein VFE13_08075 [Caulobacteraceae bacterium]|jgi:hypothetical protein|nr:hypothetical protein [Caulobacteraceae bacterium]
MDRRKFVAVGAGAIAASATGAVAAVAAKPARVAQRVTLSGWIEPAGRGPGHYFVLGPDAGFGDPAAPHVEAWPRNLTLVLPRDATQMRTGAVTIEGRLHRGRFVDLPTGHAAAAVLTDATVV